MQFVIQRIITSVMILGYGCFVYFLFKQDINAVKISFCVLIIIVMGTYFIHRNKGAKECLLGFLFFHLLAKFMSLFEFVQNTTLLYSIVSFSYMLSYILLIYMLSQTVVYSELWDKFKRYIIVLGVFGIFVLYYIYGIMLPKSDILMYPFMVEIYGFIVLVLLCLSFLSYVYHDSKKPLILFLICLSFSFSEVAQLGYVYVSKSFVLFVLFSVFKLAGFFFYYYYLRIKSDVHYRLLS